MIVNVIDSTVGVPPLQRGSGTVNLRWHASSPLPTALPPYVGIGDIHLMRIIGPQRDIAALANLVRGAVPSLRRYFGPGGYIEIYGRQVSNTIGGSLGGDRLNTIGGSLRRDNLNTIGGSLRADRQNTIGGALSGDALNTIGGSLSPDFGWALMGAQRLWIRP